MAYDPAPLSLISNQIRRDLRLFLRQDSAPAPNDRSTFPPYRSRAPHFTIEVIVIPNAEAHFGFVLVGGALVGAQVRDIRLANELVRRGYPVSVWWVFDRPHNCGLLDSIPQRWLCHSFRYATSRPSSTLDTCGRLISRLTSDGHRAAVTQKFPMLVTQALKGLIRIASNAGPSSDVLFRRFASEVRTSGVTHVLPNLSVLAPIVQSALQSDPARQFAVTFQGYELYATYARAMNLEEQLFDRIRAATRTSGLPAIAVSDAYAERIVAEIGLDRGELVTMPPGIPVIPAVPRADAQMRLQTWLDGYDPSLPLVGFLGRRDAEKGIDLLLYAARILREVEPFQLCICGPTAFGQEYVRACQQIAGNLSGVRVLWQNELTESQKTDFLAASHCVVYPSIHEEPFGMVPVEAMMQGTPCLVSDSGGVESVVRDGGQRGGLTFRSWDSGALAQQLHRMLTDGDLHNTLACQAPTVAAKYSMCRLGNRFLEFLGLPRHAQEGCVPEFSRAA